MTAVMVIIEDENEDALLLQLYQQLDESIRPASSIITNGDVLLIKEPFFKIMGDSEYGLRIDHIGDLVHIDPRDKLWPKEWISHPSNLTWTADNWKLEGNAIRRKQYWNTIRRY